MPSSISGAFAAFLFVLLLIPGFVYIRVRERDTPERRRSAFRETIGVATASIVADAAALGLFALIRWRWPAVTPDVARLIRDGKDYLASGYPLLAMWTVALIAVAAGGAWGVAKLLRKTKTDPAYGSSWWLLFGTWYPREAEERRLKVGCVLDDGSCIEGILASWNDLGDDSPDRDLVLVEPLTHRLKNEDTSQPYGASVATVSASRIVTMFVTPLERAPRPLTSGLAAAAQPASAAEDQ